MAEQAGEGYVGTILLAGPPGAVLVFSFLVILAHRGFPTDSSSN